MLSLDLKSLRSAFESGSLTPTALIEDLWRRIEAYDDPALWIHRRSRAELLDSARRVESRGPAAQPLYGVPFAIKDNIDLVGTPTTAACPEFAYTPTVSATVVRQLLEAGAIPIGKVNLDQFATGLVGVRSPYGTPRNPFRTDVIPGGSSSGSAVAVAAELVSFALGTDTAGSGRIPAGFNNLVGLKPTRGALSTNGVVPACRSLDCVSIFALTCADAAEIMQVAEGYDPSDPFSRRRSESEIETTGRRVKTSRLRVGVPDASGLEFFGDAEAKRQFGASLAQLLAGGAELIEIDFTPFRQTADLLYQGPWIAERWAALRPFHRDHADAFFPVTRKIVEKGATLTAADAFEGLHQLARLRRRADQVWQNIDVLIVPTAPRPYTLAEVDAEPVLTNSRLGTYTNFVNLLDLSALAVPAGIRSDGIPCGITFIAPAWQEQRLLAYGSRWESKSKDRRDNEGNAGARLPAVVGSSYLVVGQSHPTEIAPAPSAQIPLSPTTNYQLPTTANPERPTTTLLAVVGAHLSGLPLNHQLTDRGAKLHWTGTTASTYRLYALPGTTPPKPGLVRVLDSGAAIAVEVWEIPIQEFGGFVAAIPQPLGIGSVILSTGEVVKGFLCESAALLGAIDITSLGGWRNYLRDSAPPKSSPHVSR